MKTSVRNVIVNCMVSAHQIIREQDSRRAGNQNSSLEILPGTPYSRYAVPLDYLPSRRFEPRWGYGKPGIAILDQWFSEHIDSYRDFLKQMDSFKSSLLKIKRDFDHGKLPEPAWLGVPLSTFDAAAIYSMIRYLKPKRYFEIGSGISTCFVYQAVKDAGIDTHILSIDPEPRADIGAICNEIIRDGLETCDLTLFDRLEPGDVLFFDGSHRSFMNSDVTVFMIDILPRLKPGVIVHVHDILLPWDYPTSFKDWYWNEQYLLAVYLMGSRDRIKPLLPTAFICRSPALADWFENPFIDLEGANDSWHGGGSMWFTHK